MCVAKLPPEVIRAALTGNYQPEHLFALSQALALYDFYQDQVRHTDAQIEQVLSILCKDRTIPDIPLSKKRRGQNLSAPNALNFDVRAALYQLVGTDLTQIHGIGPYLALRLISECGTDLSRWPRQSTLRPG
jgi:transposase